MEPKQPKPKIHKKEGNPGILVSSFIYDPKANIYDYVDFHLLPLAKKLKSCAQDTTDFIKKLKTTKNSPQRNSTLERPRNVNLTPDWQ